MNSIIAELDEIYFYKHLVNLTDDKNFRIIFIHVEKEEKEHVGEFQYP
ncbi:MAG: hypothetical protein ACFFG0_09940 [Candidatus Thorarchaeota archaeon]